MKTSDKMNIDLVRQYAENQNQRQSIVIVVIGCFALAIGSFGYTLAQFIISPDYKHVFLLTFATVFSMFITLLIAVLSLFYSYSLRRDQKIIDKIRKDLCGKTEYKKYYTNYRPKNTLQDFYRILFSGSLIFKTGLLFAYVFSIVKFYNCDYSILISITIYFLFVGCSIIIWLYYKNKLERQCRN